MSKATPGPWTFVLGGSGDSPTWGVRFSDNSVVNLPACNPLPVMDANARLIAAAPDLLEALKAEEEWRGRDEDGSLDPEWDYETMVGSKRRAAIAKAEGDQQ